RSASGRCRKPWCSGFRKWMKLTSCRPPSNARWTFTLWVNCTCSPGIYSFAEAGGSSQSSATLQREIFNMGKLLEPTWEQELLAKGEAQGEARGQLLAYRQILRDLLEVRFGPLPEALVQRIQEVNEADPLQAAIR